MQVYLRDIAASITRPVRELKAFRKVHLKAGEKRRLDFTLTPMAMAFLDEDMRMTVEAGEFEVFVGNSCEADLSAKFTVETSKLVSDEETSSAPIVTEPVTPTATSAATLPVNGFVTAWMLFLLSSGLALSFSDAYNCFL